VAEEAVDFGHDMLGDHFELFLSPRGAADPRFTWRRADIPAASHPTIAAALARVGGVRAAGRSGVGGIR